MATINGTTADNKLTGTSGNDTLNGLAGDDTLNGGAGADVLYGDDGDDVLNGGTGADTMFGGIWSDQYYVDNMGDVIVEDIGNVGWGDTVYTTLSTYTLGALLEDLEYIGTGNFTGTLSDRGGSLTSKGGNDTLTGGVDGDSFWANAGNDKLYGLAGDDFLNGGTGADRMEGGAGNDNYVVDNVNDVVIENPGSGRDGIDTSLYTYTLGANVEDLTYKGDQYHGFTGTGNDLSGYLQGGPSNDLLMALGGNDWVWGFAGNDTLDGGSGADTMEGGEGNDTYVVDDAGDVVYEYSTYWGTDTVRTSFSSYSLATVNYVENITYTGSASFSGTGNELNNNIKGGAGNDTLAGGGGKDTIFGGDGDDTLNGDAGSDTLKGQAGNDALNGGVDNDNLMGGGGNDTMDGGTGADVMYGGAGNDTYKVDNAGDKVYESTDATGAVDSTGTDMVESSVSFTLGAFVENLTLTGSDAIDGTGNALRNTLTGNGAANTLIGGGGGDTLNAGGGDDILKGGGGSDVLNGEAGNDALYGGPGNDTLTGGAGDDVFVFNAALNSAAAPNVDVIADFKANAEADQIHLDNAIFTKLKTEGALSAENLKFGTAAADANDYIIYDSGTGNLWYDADGSGAGAKVKIAVLTDHPTLVASDIVVI